MTLRQSLGRDVQQVYEHVEALLDREDGVLVLFDGNQVVTYTHGFDVSPSQLELLGVELERTLRAALGRGPANGARKRRDRERHQGNRTDDGVDRNDRGIAGRVLRLANKIA